MTNPNSLHAPRSLTNIDAHVGARIRVRRKDLKMSQQKLGDGLSVTFQQVQKYENGTNSVPASRLWELCHALEVPCSYFFEGLESGLFFNHETPPETQALIKMINSSEGVSFAKALIRIPRFKRHKLLELALVMAGEADGGLLPLDI